MHYIVAQARTSTPWASSKLRAEHELNPPRRARARSAGIQHSRNPPKARRRLDRQVRSAARYRSHTRARRLEFRMIQQIKSCRSKIQCQPLAHLEALLQRRVYLKRTWSIRNIPAEIAPSPIGGSG